MHHMREDATSSNSLDKIAVKDEGGGATTSLGQRILDTINKAKTDEAQRREDSKILIKKELQTHFLKTLDQYSTNTVIGDYGCRYYNGVKFNTSHHLYYQLTYHLSNNPAEKSFSITFSLISDSNLPPYLDSKTICGMFKEVLEKNHSHISDVFPTMVVTEGYDDVRGHVTYAIVDIVRVDNVEEQS